MSWLFSQALVAEYSAASCSDGEPCAQLNVMPTQHKFWRNDKTMESSSLSRFGLTCAVLTEDRGAELLTSYLAGFRAKTSVRQDLAQDSTVRAPDSGAKWRGWFATFDQASSTWKTAQCSLLGDSELFSETWPRWGSMRSGASYLRPTPALPICESASGYWPTPNVPNGGRAMSKEMALNGGYTADGKKRQIDLGTAVKYWPTPVSSDTGSRKKQYAQGGMALSLAVKSWPTPTAQDSQQAGGMGCITAGKRGYSLHQAVRLWPTAQARDWRSGKASQATHDKNSRPLSEQVGGLLNPDWTEWLMGWPIGWTELKPLAMDKFREWQQQHGACSEVRE